MLTSKVSARCLRSFCTWLRSNCVRSMLVYQQRTVACSRHVTSSTAEAGLLDYESVALYYVNAAMRCIHALCPISVHHYKLNI